MLLWRELQTCVAAQPAPGGELLDRPLQEGGLRFMDPLMCQALVAHIVATPSGLQLPVAVDQAGVSIVKAYLSLLMQLFVLGHAA